MALSILGQAEPGSICIPLSNSTCVRIFFFFFSSGAITCINNKLPSDQRQAKGRGSDVDSNSDSGC